MRTEGVCGALRPVGLSLNELSLSRAESMSTPVVEMEPFRYVTLSSAANEDRDIFLYIHLLSVKAYPISISRSCGGSRTYSGKY